MTDTQPTSTELPQRGDDPLDSEFRRSYFKQLVGQFNTIGDEVKNDEVRKQGQTIAALDIEKVQWDDIYQLELAILRLLPEIQLRRRVWSLRSEYENVAPKEYQKYLKSNPPDPDKDAVERVRADAIQIQEELNWYYTVLWVQEGFRSLLLKRVTQKTLQYFAGYFCIGILLMALGFLGGLADLFGKANLHGGEGLDVLTVATNGQLGQTTVATNAVSVQSAVATNGVSVQTIVATSVLPNAHTNSADTTATNGPASSVMKERTRLQRAKRTIQEALPVFGTYWLVVFAGTLGAMVSILRRIQTMSLDGNSDTSLVELDRSSASISYSPLLGAVFALLLLFLFMGGLLSGSLFPKCSDTPTNVFLGCVPLHCVDLAKLIIWCFIAGFAEKFVPDALDKLQGQSPSEQKPTAPK